MTAVLVILPSQSGPQPQIWYGENNRFVGCAGLQPIEKVELPPLRIGQWDIEAAVAFATQK
jgi:hypothetical protein